MRVYEYESQGGRRASFSAVLSAERDIRIDVPDLEITFSGHVELPGIGRERMVLTQTGGADSGMVWNLSYDDGPG